MADHNNVGKWGERLACDYLTALGYAIIDTNVHIGKNEIDIIAEHSDRIVFVEVKTRTDADSDPIDAIDSKKIMHLCRGAEAYVQALNLPHEVQFDVIVVIGTQQNHTIEHYPDSIRPMMNRI